MKNNGMSLYIIFSREAYSCNEPEQCAGVAVAHTAKEARVVGWDTFNCEVTDSYIDVGAQLLRKSDYLWSEADQEKCKNGVPHAFYPAGWSYTKIGRELHISPRTAMSYATQARLKLGASNMIEAVAIGIKAGIIGIFEDTEDIPHTVLGESAESLP